MISQVRTGKFFVLGPPLPEVEAADLNTRHGGLPDDYLEFLKTFGPGDCFRHLNRDNYHLSVFLPKESEWIPGQRGLLIGHYGDSSSGSIFFHRSKPEAPYEDAVYCFIGNRLSKANASFSEWLRKRCTLAKARYREKEWRQILAGPPPFDEREIKIVNAIKGYKWKVVGTTDDEAFVFEVFNGSSITLPYLTIGVNVKNRFSNWYWWLPVQDVQPGETKRVVLPYYKSIARPEQIEFFQKAPPGPEDRPYYKEFQPLKDTT